MGHDFRGDPSSAMLEVLDPEQNSTFADHYLEVSTICPTLCLLRLQILLICRDRYLIGWKLSNCQDILRTKKAEIAKRHLIKKQVENHGLDEKEFIIKDKGLYEIIRHYTREAGVRNLEREISKLCRKVLTHIIKDKRSP